MHSARTTGLHVEELTSAAALEVLWPQWMRLWGRTPGATPFQTPQWLVPWWRHVGQGRLLTLAMRDEPQGELVGLLPLYVYSDAEGRRHLFPIGIATTDYLDVLARAGVGQRVVGAMMAHLQRRSEAWDVLEFPQLRAESPLLSCPTPDGWRKAVEGGEPNPILRLKAPDCGGIPIPAAMANNLRYYRRRAERAGRVRYEQADARTIGEVFEALVRLHTQRWEQRGEGGVLSDPGVLVAHRQAVPQLHEAGLLRLCAMRLDGRIVAVVYCLADEPAGQERRWYYYLGGFDPHDAAISPGTLLVGYAIERAAAEGAGVFDFLRGREGYKYHWGARDQLMHTLRLWHAGNTGEAPVP